MGAAKSHEVELTHNAIVETPSGVEILKYHKMDNIHNFVCGIEFRKIAIPHSVKEI